MPAPAAANCGEGANAVCKANSINSLDEFDRECESAGGKVTGIGASWEQTIRGMFIPAEVSRHIGLRHLGSGNFGAWCL